MPERAIQYTDELYWDVRLRLETAWNQSIQDNMTWEQLKEHAEGLLRLVEEHEAQE
jgi:hypothetical protein